MKNKLLFSISVLAVWFFTINLPIWKLEIPGVVHGYSLMDDMSTLVNDNYHLPFMFFSGPLIALVAFINPKKYLLGVVGFYYIILIMGFLGFAFSEHVALKYGWYLHFIGMGLVVMLAGNKFLPEVFQEDQK